MLGAAFAGVFIYAMPHLVGIAQAAMFVIGLLLFAAWYHYTKVAVMAGILERNSLGLTTLAVMSSVLVAIPFCQLTSS